MGHIHIKLGEASSTIHPELHSQFIEHLGSCINDGIWVGEDSDIPNYEGLRKDVVDALAKIAPPVIRWPGGCYADMYHWRNGIGPKEDRPVTYNNNFGTAAIENNHFGTHEFMKLCRMVGAKPWLNINMLSGTVSEMVDWAEYCNRTEATDLAKERAANGDEHAFGVEYWGIGNESWAGGGNYTPEGYANDYRKFTSAFPTFGRMTMSGFNGTRQQMIAVGPDGNKPRERVEWSKRFFRALSDFRQPRIDAYDLHFYNWNIQTKDDHASTFGEQGWYRVIHGACEIEEVIREQYALIQEGLAGFPAGEGLFPARPASCDLIIGEWGNWHRSDPSTTTALKQQSSMRDAITSAVTLDIFHRNCDILKLACVAQTVNVLNSLVLTFGSKTVLTPTYHVFDMYKVHRGAEGVPCDVVCQKAYESGDCSVDDIYSFASVKDGVVSINIVNANLKEDLSVSISFDGNVTYLSGTVLKGSTPQDYNSPENPNAVVPAAAAPAVNDGGKWVLELPSASVSVYQFSVS